MKNVGLVIEGGGFRGYFATGVLDFFMDKQVQFKYVNGVSFGCINACSYISNQRGRTKRILDNYRKDKRYMGIKYLFKEGNIFNIDFSYNKIPYELDRWDIESFINSNTKFNMVVTNCKTGKAEYLEKNTLSKDTVLDAVRASSSLPVISQMVEINNNLYLDGGLSDSIPIKKAIKDGYEKNIIILTRDLDYRKKPSKFKNIIRWKYKDYPKLIECIENRYKMYNETIEYINKLEKEGRVFVIRPKKNLKVGRLERNLSKINSIYNYGIKIAEKNFNNMIKFIDN